MTSSKCEAEIRPYNGRPTVFIDGEPHPMPGFNPNPRGTDRIFERAADYFFQHKLGVYIIHAPIDPFWQGDDIYDTPQGYDPQYFGVDESAEYALAGDPDAYLMVRFTPSPPTSWKALHLNEYALTEAVTTPGSPSLASDLFWEAMARVSTTIVQYCESRPWADRLMGYTNFHVTEGTHMPVDLGWLYDHNPVMVTRWRTFLQAKYHTEEALQKAYGDEAPTFDTMQVPRDPLRGAVPDVTNMLYWQPAQQNQGLRDYLELQRDLWHERFRQICAAMEDGVDRRVVFLYDALKQTQQGWNLGAFFHEKISWSPAYAEVMAGSGHISVAPLLDTPGCDGLMTPLDYQARGIGGVCEAEGIADSVVLRGKYYFAEMDQRTVPLGEIDYGTPRNDREFAALTWRNFATAWTRGFNAYLFDIGGGFYDTDARHDIIGRQIEMIKDSLYWPHENMPGIAMIIDDTAVLETNGSGNFLNEAVMWEQKMGIARCGVPFRIYLFDDLLLDDFPDHRVYYFPNLFRVDEERLEVLENKVFQDGRVVVWGPGSGISDGQQISTASATALTGFEFDLMPVNTQRRIVLTNFDHSITQDLDPAAIIGGPLAYGPILFPTDGLDLGMAWTKWQCNQVGLAVKTFGKGAAGDQVGKVMQGEGDYAAVFTTAVPLPADLWRGISRYAGAHVYCDDNEVVLADNSLVAMHSMKSGTKRLALPGNHKVTDLITGESFGDVTDLITFELNAPETRVFLLEAPES